MTQEEQVKAIRGRYKHLTPLSCRMLVGGMTFYSRVGLLGTVERLLEWEVGGTEPFDQCMYNSWIEHVKAILIGGRIKLRKGEAIPMSHNLE